MVRIALAEVLVSAIVVDRAGEFVPGLTADDFVLYDSSRRQTITSFHAGPSRFSGVFLIDASGGMTPHFETVPRVVRRLVLSMRPDDRVRLGSFADRVGIGPVLLSNRADLPSGTDMLVPGNASRLFDATWSGLDAMRLETNRKVILAFSDGNDTGSSAGLAATLQRAQAEGVTIHGLAFPATLYASGPDGRFGRLVDETGGSMQEARRLTDLDRLVDRVGRFVREPYLLGFVPEIVDGRLRDLEVRVGRPGLKVLARKRYMAARPR
jgi:VWFA-related protein